MSHGMTAAVTHHAFVKRRLERLTDHGWRSYDDTGKDVTAAEIEELKDELIAANEWVDLIEREEKR